MTKTMDIKSLLIGFLLATSVMLFMGATSDNGNGRYQGFSNGKHVYMINTQDGQLLKLDTGGCNCSHCTSNKHYGTKKWKQASKGFLKINKK